MPDTPNSVGVSVHNTRHASHELKGCEHGSLLPPLSLILQSPLTIFRAFLAPVVLCPVKAFPPMPAEWPDLRGKRKVLTVSPLELPFTVGEPNRVGTRTERGETVKGLVLSPLLMGLQPAASVYCTNEGLARSCNKLSLSLLRLPTGDLSSSWAAERSSRMVPEGQGILQLSTEGASPSHQAPPVMKRCPLWRL